MANKASDSPVKVTAVRCIAAALCTAVVCGCVFKCTSDYSKVIKENINAAGTSVQPSGNEPSGEAPTSIADDGSIVIDGTAPADETPAADTDTKADSTTKANGTTTKAASGAFTKDQIISMFNTAANSAKSSSKSIRQNYCKNTQTSEAQLKNATLKSIANKLISANMGADKKKANATYTSAAEKNANFPVSGQTWSSKLTSADVKDAKITKANGVYTIVIKLVDDTTPNIKKGGGHAGKAFSIVTKDQIVDGAGSLGMSVIKEESINLTYKDCVITAKVDATTNRLKSVNYFQDWKLALTAMGIDVAIAFGCEEDYTINW